MQSMHVSDSHETYLTGKKKKDKITFNHNIQKEFIELCTTERLFMHFIDHFFVDSFLFFFWLKITH